LERLVEDGIITEIFFKYGKEYNNRQIAASLAPCMFDKTVEFSVNLDNSKSGTGYRLKPKSKNSIGIPNIPLKK
jgi:hypothetical protein